MSGRGIFGLALPLHPLGSSAGFLPTFDPGEVGVLQTTVRSVPTLDVDDAVPVQARDAFVLTGLFPSLWWTPIGATAYVPAVVPPPVEPFAYGVMIVARVRVQ